MLVGSITKVKSWFCYGGRGRRVGVKWVRYTGQTQNSGPRRLHGPSAPPEKHAEEDPAPASSLQINNDFTSNPQKAICLYEKIIGIMVAKTSDPKTLIRHQTGLVWRDGIPVSPPFRTDRCVFGLTHNLLGLRFILPPSPNCFSHYHWILFLFLFKKEKKSNWGSDWEVFIIPLCRALFQYCWSLMSGSNAPTQLVSHQSS